MKADTFDIGPPHEAIRMLRFKVLYTNTYMILNIFLSTYYYVYIDDVVGGILHDFIVKPTQPLVCLVELLPVVNAQNQLLMM